MILKALENGVDEECIGKALDLDVKKTREKRDLLKGICPEAVAIIKDRPVSRAALRYFKRVRPLVNPIEEAFREVIDWRQVLQDDRFHTLLQVRALAR